MKSLILALILLLPSTVLSAGVVNNSTTSQTAADSLGMEFWLVDSIGILVDLHTTNDSLFLSVNYPGGTVLAFSEEIRGDNARILSNTKHGYKTYVLGNQVSNIDGSTPKEGIYTWNLMVFDSSLGLPNVFAGTFQLYIAADYDVRLDNLDAAITSRSSHAATDIVSDGTALNTTSGALDVVSTVVNGVSVLTNDTKVIAGYAKDSTQLIIDSALSIMGYKIDAKTIWYYGSDADSINCYDDSSVLYAVIIYYHPSGVAGQVPDSTKVFAR